MLYGLKEYEKEKSEVPAHSRILTIFIILLLLAVIYVFYVIVYHPWVDVRLETSRGNETVVTFTFTNVGLMPDGNVNIERVTEDGREDVACDISMPEQCFESENTVICRRFMPSESIIYRCTIRSDRVSIRFNMMSTYQSIRNVYDCGYYGCKERVSPVYGSTPIVWNYIFLYPLERFFDVIMVFL